jgi:hypothetical protein
MAKKNFKQNVGIMFGSNDSVKKEEKKSSAEKGTKEGETRATFIVNKDLLEKSKALAYWERLKYKDVINRALEEYISNFEKEHGVIKPIPEK